MSIARSCTLALAVSLSFGAATQIVAANPTDKSQQAAQIKSLVHADRNVRRLAAAALFTNKSLPAAVVPPALEYLEHEVKDILADGASGGQDFVNCEPAGTDVSAQRLEKESARYVDKPFTICGQIVTDSYWGGDYRYSKSSHYSFAFTFLGRGGETNTQSIHLYLNRLTGAALAEAITISSEQTNRWRLVRARVRIANERYLGPANWEFFELQDLQFWDHQKQRWGPWALEGVATGLGMLVKAGRPAIKPVIDRIVADIPKEEAGDAQGADYQAVEETLRSVLVAGLAAMNVGNRRMAVAQLIQRLRQAKPDSVGGRWAQLAAQRLQNGP